MDLYINLKMNSPIQGATQMGVDWTLLFFACKILDSSMPHAYASRWPEHERYVAEYKKVKLMWYM